MGRDFFIREDGERSVVCFRDDAVGKPVRLASYILREDSAADMTFEEGVEVFDGKYRGGVFSPSLSKPRDPDETLVLLNRDQHLALFYKGRRCLINLRTNEIVGEG